MSQLIASRWVVTAAHCTIGSVPADMVVVVGAHSLQGQSSDPCVEERLVSEIYNHPGYNDFTIGGNADDISLLKLAAPVGYAPVDQLDGPGYQSVAQPGVCLSKSI